MRGARRVRRRVGSRRSSTGPTRWRSRCPCTPRPAWRATWPRGIDTPVRVFGLYAEQCHDFATPVEWDAPAPRRVTCSRRSTATPASTIGGEQRLVGSVLASHGCAHRCRHCPVPVVFDGRVRRVDEDAVLADIAQLVAAGARHITFGDPDFLNAPPHSRRHRARDARAVPRRHLRLHGQGRPRPPTRRPVARVRRRGVCVRGVRVRVGRRRGARTASTRATPPPTRPRAVAILRDAGIEVRPSWMPFTPWTTRDDVIALLDFVARARPRRQRRSGAVQRAPAPPRGLAAARPPRSDPVRGPVGPRAVDVHLGAPGSRDRRAAAVASPRSWTARNDPITVYGRVRVAAGAPPVDLTRVTTGRPRLSESWFCCAEPTELQLTRLSPAVHPAGVGAHGDSSESCC